MRRLLLLACCLLTVALSIYPLAVAPIRPGVVVLGLAALALFGGGLLAPDRVGAGFPLIVLMMEYGFALIERSHGIDPGAPVYAVALYLLAELLDLRGATRGPVEVEGAVGLGRAATILAAGVGGGLGAAAILLTGSMGAAEGTLQLIVAAAAAVVALTIASGVRRATP